MPCCFIPPSSISSCPTGQNFPTQHQASKKPEGIPAHSGAARLPLQNRKSWTGETQHFQVQHIQAFWDSALGLYELARCQDEQKIILIIVDGIKRYSCKSTNCWHKRSSTMNKTTTESLSMLLSHPLVYIFINKFLFPIIPASKFFSPPGFGTHGIYNHQVITCFGHI